MAGGRVFLFLAVFLTMLCLHVEFASAFTWWNESFTFKRQITIDNTANGNDLYNYTVPVNVTYSANMQNDFDDIRFVQEFRVYELPITIQGHVQDLNDYQVKINITDANIIKNIIGKYGEDIRFFENKVSDPYTNTTGKLHYWIEKFNKTENELVVWVKVNLTANTSKTIYMYYGYTESIQKGYRKIPLEIYGQTENLNDYQVKIKITKPEIIDEIARDDAGDLRFFENEVSDPYSATTGKLHYWIEKFNKTTNELVVWVKVNLTANTSKTIWMYYGNESASSESNGTAVFEFFDDFSTNSIGTKWFIDSGTWSINITDKYLRGVAGSAPSGRIGEYATILANTTPIPLYSIIEADVMQETYGSSIFIYSENPLDNVKAGASIYSNIDYLDRIRNDTSYVQVGNSRTTGVYYHWKIIVNSTNVVLFVDGIKSISIPNYLPNDNYFLRLAAGLNPNEISRFKNIKVRKYTPNEPQVRIKCGYISDGDCVFEFFDDFEEYYDGGSLNGINNWTVTGSEQFTAQSSVVAEGKLAGKYYGGSQIRTGVFWDFGLRTSDFVLEYYYYPKHLGGAGYPGVVFGTSYDLSPSWGSSMIYHEDSTNKLLWRDSSGVDHDIFNPLTEDKWYFFREVHHPQTKTYDLYVQSIDGIYMWFGNNLTYNEQEDPRYFKMVDPGGTEALGYSSGYVDAIRIRKYASSEPAAITGTPSIIKTIYLKAPYWIESKSDGAWAYVWIKVPYMRGGDVTNNLWMYYRNANVLNESNGDEVFLFFDDFNRMNSSDLGVKWIEIDGGNGTNITISDNHLDIESKNAYFNWFALGGKGFSRGGFIIEYDWNADGYSFNTNGRVMKTIGIGGGGDSENPIIYGFEIMQTDKAASNIGSYIRVVNGTKTTIGSIGVSWPYSEWSKWKVVIKPDLTIEVEAKWSAGTYNFTIPPEPYNFVNGSIFVGVGDSNEEPNFWYLDNLRVREYAGPEPTAYESGVEHFIGCGYLDVDRTKYYLERDLVDSAAVACINITSNNVVLDCQGYRIDGVDTTNTYGIYAYRSTATTTNITVRNCIISDWANGIYFYRANKNKIENVTSNSNILSGIRIINTNNTVVYNVTTNFNTDGLQIESVNGGKAHNNIVDKLIAINNAGDGIYVYSNARTSDPLDNVYNLTIQNSYIDGSNYGIYFEGENNNVLVRNNEIRNINQNAIHIDDWAEWYMYNYTIINNTIINNTRGVYHYYDSYELYNLTVFSNYFEGSSYACIFLDDLYGYNISNNTLVNCGNYAIFSDWLGSGSWVEYHITNNNITLVDTGIRLGYSVDAGAYHKLYPLNLDNNIMKDVVYGILDDVYSAAYPMNFSAKMFEGNTFENVTWLFYDKDRANIFVNENVVLPKGNYFLNDTDKNGGIIINSSNVVLDCGWANITGDGDGNLDGYGIFSNKNTNITIKNCFVWKFWNGIEIQNTNNSVITNIIASNNTDEANIYLYNSHYNNLTHIVANYNDNWAGVYLDKSNYNFLLNITVKYNYDGIEIDRGASYNKLYNITAKNNLGDGIWTCCPNTEALNNEIKYLISENNWAGMEFYGAENNTLSDSIFKNNQYGIYISSSSNNLVYNNFFNNSVNVYFSGTIYQNLWNTTKRAGLNIRDGNYIGGNFWAKPDGTGYSEICDDVDQDGFCDIPYDVVNDSACTTISLCSSNIDFLPLSIIKFLELFLYHSSTDYASDSRTYAYFISPENLINGIVFVGGPLHEINATSKDVHMRSYYSGEAYLVFTRNDAKKFMKRVSYISSGKSEQYGMFSFAYTLSEKSVIRIILQLKDELSLLGKEILTAGINRIAITNLGLDKNNRIEIYVRKV